MPWVAIHSRMQDMASMISGSLTTAQVLVAVDTSHVICVQICCTILPLNAVPIQWHHRHRDSIGTLRPTQEQHCTYSRQVSITVEGGLVFNHLQTSTSRQMGSSRADPRYTDALGWTACAAVPLTHSAGLVAHAPRAVAARAVHLLLYPFVGGRLHAIFHTLAWVRLALVDWWHADWEFAGLLLGTIHICRHAWHGHDYCLYMLQVVWGLSLLIAAPVLLSARLIPDSHVEALLGAAAVGAVFAELFMIKARAAALQWMRMLMSKGRLISSRWRSRDWNDAVGWKMLQGLLIFDPAEGDRVHGRDSQTGQLAVPRWNLALVRAWALDPALCVQLLPNSSI
jgi:hypothetical protein